jgi:hypothetical protein
MESEEGRNAQRETFRLWQEENKNPAGAIDTGKNDPESPPDPNKRNWRDLCYREAEVQRESSTKRKRNAFNHKTRINFHCLLHDPNDSHGCGHADLPESLGKDFRCVDPVELVEEANQRYEYVKKYPREKEEFFTGPQVNEKMTMYK